MKRKKAAALFMAAVMTCTAAGCGSSGEGDTAGGEEVVIYSNADDEAVEAMKKTLDENGYEGKYLFQTFGTSELGGKVMAEGHEDRGRSSDPEYFLYRQRAGRSEYVPGSRLFLSAD